MTIEKIHFQNLLKDDYIFFYKDTYIDVLDDNKAWFGNIIFKETLLIDDMGITFKQNKGISTLAFQNTSDKTFLFNFNEIAISNTIKSIQFDNCLFNEEPIFENGAIQYISFYDCIFNCDINSLLKKFENYSLEIKFYNCKISKFSLINISKNDTTNIFELYGGKIEFLDIHNKIIKNKFYINKQYNGNTQETKITNLSIKNTTFKKNFKLHHCNVTNTLIADVDFNKHADFFRSTFIQGYSEDSNKNIYFKAINFKGLALFGDCEFKEKLIFEYITFESFSHFRRTKFLKGLDLDYTNIQQEMNFFSVEKLDSEESKENTSQETYRIIKHNFEKINNKVEANKYHALELEKKKNILNKKLLLKLKYYGQNYLYNIWGSKPHFYDKNINIEVKKNSFLWNDLAELLILKIHWFSSKNGTNWFIPFLLILLVGFLTLIGMHWTAFKDFLCHPIDNNTYLKDGFFKSIKYMYILYKNNELWETHPFIFTLNKFSLGYLYYQFLIAVRKDTRK